MTNAATPTEQNQGGTPPVAPVATPANADQGNTPPEGGTPAEKPAETTPPEGGEATSVTLTKEEHEKLQRDASRARSNQSKADRYDRVIGKGGSHFKQQAPATPPSEDEKAEAAVAEDRKAERGLLAIAADPAYRKALDADPTLRNLLTTNPLSVLPMLAPDALDAEDAISLVKEELVKKVEAIEKATPLPKPNEVPTDDKGNMPVNQPVTPPSGGINPLGGTTPDAEYESARKNPNIEGAISGMVKVGLKRQGGK